MFDRYRGAQFALVIAGVLAVASFAEAQIGAAGIQITVGPPQLHVAVTQGGQSYDCVNPRPENDEVHYMRIRPEVGDLDFSIYRFYCGQVLLTYGVNAKVVEVGVVDGQFRPTVVNYISSMDILMGEDGDVKLQWHEELVNAAPGQLLIELGRPEAGVPGVVFYDAKDFTTWEVIPNPG